MQTIKTACAVIERHEIPHPILDIGTDIDTDVNEFLDAYLAGGNAGWFPESLEEAEPPSHDGILDSSFLDDYIANQLSEIPAMSGDDEDDLQSLMPSDIVDKNGRKYRFGNRHLDEAYAILKRALRDHDVACLFHVVEQTYSTSVDVCNFWRLTRRKDGARVTCEYKYPASFVSIGKLICHPPHIMLVPPAPHTTLWKTLIGTAVNFYVFHFAGTSNNERAVLERARSFDTFYLVDKVLVESTQRQLFARLGAQKISSLSQTISKIIWRCIIDRQFFSKVAYANILSPVSLADYMSFARVEKDITYLFENDKKMLVLHDVIAFAELISKEPFSVKRWTVQGVMSECFHGEVRYRLSSPSSVSALNCLHPAMLKAWGHISVRGGFFNVLFDVLGKLRNEAPIPQPVMWSIIKSIGSASPFPKTSLQAESLSHLIRLYVREAKRLRTTGAESSYRDAIRTLEFVSVLDFWEHIGFQEGLPGRQSTWRSMSGRSRTWHHTISQAPFPQDQARIVWASHLQETNVGEVIAVPLTSGAELAAEGQAMRHCVGTYTRQCANGNLRIFSLRHPDGRRSTLSIVHAGNFWKISQNLAEQNRMPDKALLAVGKVIAKLYNKAEKLMGQM